MRLNKPSYNIIYMGRKSIFHMVLAKTIYWLIYWFESFPIMVITDQTPLTVMKDAQSASILAKILRGRDQTNSALIVVSFQCARFLVNCTLKLFNIMIVFEKNICTMNGCTIWVATMTDFLFWITLRRRIVTIWQTGWRPVTPRL